MAHPDHDAAFGRLAAARLRAVSDEARLDAHPDAETWAAYADGGLGADEIAALEAHLAACASCRRLVAALMPEPAEAAPAADTLEAAGPARILPFRPRVTWAWMAAAAGLLGAVTLWSVARLQEPRMASTMAERTPPAPAAAPMAQPAEPAPPPAAAPADAARSAAPLADAPGSAARRGAAPAAEADEFERAKARLDKSLSVASDDVRDLKLAGAEKRAQVTGSTSPAATGSEVARGRVAANEPVAVPQASSVPPPAAPPPPRPAASTPSFRTAPASPGVHGPAVNTQQQNQQAMNAQAAAAAQIAAQEAAARRAAAAQQAELAKTMAKEKDEVATRQADARAQPVAVAQAPPPPAEPQAAGQVAETVSVTRPAPTTARSGVRREGFGEAKRDAGSARAVREEPAFTAAAAPADIPFAEPGGRLRWRIAGGYRIESSSDAGVTWNERYTATERLRAGSAPAIDNAWAAGERGLVLRLAVPGTWTPVARPAAVTIVAVTATSADAARVTTEDGRVFETQDGGRSWRPLSGAGPR